MILDIDYMKSLGKFVIHCETEKQANELFDLVRRDLPGKLRGWRVGFNHWDWYKDQSCYALHMDIPGATVQFSPIRYCKKHGYRIVPFSEIIAPFDFGEIQKNTCFDVNLLYEIGV